MEQGDKKDEGIGQEEHMRIQLPLEPLEGFFNFLPWFPGLVLLVPVTMGAFAFFLGFSGITDVRVWRYFIYSLLVGIVYMLISRYTVGVRIMRRLQPRIDRLDRIREKMIFRKIR